MGLTWILEQGVFADQGAELACAARAAGHAVIEGDEHELARKLDRGFAGAVVFHGSLGLADQLARSPGLRPGAFCRTDEFLARRSQLRLGADSVQRRFAMTTVEALVADPQSVQELAQDGRVFVRPDSPLKPFSGRVVALDGLTGADLDLGFYYDDPRLPILVAPMRELGPERRFVIAGAEPVAGSGYDPGSRSGLAGDDSDAARYVRALVRRLDAPELVYGLDVAETENGWRVVELNPFSGMDLYDCDRAAIVKAVARALDA